MTSKTQNAIQATRFINWCVKANGDFAYAARVNIS